MNKITNIYLNMNLNGSKMIRICRDKECFYIYKNIPGTTNDVDGEEIEFFTVMLFIKLFKLFTLKTFFKRY